MSLLSNVVGFSLIGLLARFGQLGIQKRNIFSNMGGHAIAMVAFGTLGYGAYHWDQRAAVLLEEKRAEIAERRQRKVEAAQSN
ncbi:hypothetical protein BKA93DRAFT_827499 [Sparassis latifolia]|uniref:Uncharacterized protein n=1 Tax=Sparassis crispa TaxID=139825 RepID=A0A401H0K8_9APHY|nr:hypothetical protein SCP_1201920 [Sparassis crispa]GBE87966.1 hypothetical protein SCP_1201920 [Sparassis crispa]